MTNRKTFQNKIFPELNSKKHTPSPTVWFLRNCGFPQNSCCGIAQNLSFTKTEFCAKWLMQMIAQIVFFVAKNWCAKKEKFCISFHENCAKVLPMETLLQNHRSPKKRHRVQNLQCHLANKDNLQSITVIKEIVVRIVFLQKNWLLP